MKFKCKACLRKCNFIDVRSLCTHCAIKIDRADSEACDIQGIREDMYEMGVPLNSYVHKVKQYPQRSELFDDILDELMNEEDE